MSEKITEGSKLIGEEAMDALKKCIGRTVTVEHVFHGALESETEKLLKVDPFKSIVTEGGGYPFIGYGCAIKRISTEGRTIYRNPLVYDYYDLTKDVEIDEFRKESFGEKIASALLEERDEYERVYRRKGSTAETNRSYIAVNWIIYWLGQE
ncbi:MAG: hypothetical protein ABSD68_02200 [Candidatus Micrarchaeales archaeon]